MKTVLLVTIGKLGDDILASIESDYMKRLKLLKLSIKELKSFQTKERDWEEIQDFLKKIPSSSIFFLTENGSEFNSKNFSSLIFSEKQKNHLTFVIAGAHGFPQDKIQRNTQTLSLSKLTFPHQMARILLIEQLYRAETIFQNHPYHK